MGTGGAECGSTIVVEAVTKRYAGVVALDGVDIRIHQDRILGIIGPNGAGKSTLLDVIAGIARPTAGRVVLVDGGPSDVRERLLTGGELHRVARMGVVKTFQDARPFAGAHLTVLDNVLIGGHHTRASGMWQTAIGSSRYRRERDEAFGTARSMLELVGVADHAEASPSSLSYGDRRLVELARALAARPSFLLLDEPTAGLNPAETARMAEVLVGISRQGIGLVVVDHDIPFIMDLVDEVAVLSLGSVLAEGKPDHVRALDEVREAYFGVMP